MGEETEREMEPPSPFVEKIMRAARRASEDIPFILLTMIFVIVVPFLILQLFFSYTLMLISAQPYRLPIMLSADLLIVFGAFYLRNSRNRKEHERMISLIRTRHDSLLREIESELAEILERR